MLEQMQRATRWLCRSIRLGKGEALKLDAYSISDPELTESPRGCLCILLVLLPDRVPVQRDGR